MKATKKTLDSGLRLVTIPMPDTPSVTVTVWAGVGSSKEKRDKAGIAHFFEHIVFKGSQKYPSAKKIAEAVDSFGGEQNAFTGKELTGFYVKAPISRFKDAFDVVADMVFNPLIPSGDVEKEKGVIKSEIDMYTDTPLRHVYDIFGEEVFAGTALMHQVIGTKETVDNITRKDLVDYQKKFYTPDNIVITIAGGVSANEAERLVVGDSRVGIASDKKTKNLKSKNLDLSSSKPHIRVENKKTDQAHLIIGYRGFGFAGNKLRWAEDVIRAILGGGMSSRIFTEVREKRGLAYAVKTDNHNYTHEGSFQTYVGTTPQKAPDAVKLILEEYQKMTSIDTAKISDTEFKKAKEYLKGHLNLSLEDTSQVGEIHGTEEVLTGKMMTPEEIIRGIDSVTLEEAVEVARHHFKRERMALAVIGPYRSESNFTSVLRN